MNNTLSRLQSKLVQQQWTVLKKYEGKTEGLESRMSDYRLYGTHTLQTIIADAGITTDDFNRCAAAFRDDPRLIFLQRLPHAAAMGGAFGDALEKSIYQSEDGKFRETTALIGMFIRILDSLIDDAPELVISEREKLLSLLGKRSWESPVEFPSDEELNARHPAIALLYKFIRESVRRIRQSEYWRSDASIAVRDLFSTASQVALDAEYKTTRCRIENENANFDPGMRAVIREKSESMMLVVALAPITHYGWPEGLETATYERCIRNLGATFGWMDDISDLSDDFRDGNWSEVLLDLYEHAGCPPYTSREELYKMVCTWLSDEKIIDRLAAKGLQLYSETLREFEQLQINPLPIQRYVADIILSSFEVK